MSHDQPPPILRPPLRFPLFFKRAGGKQRRRSIKSYQAEDRCRRPNSRRWTILITFALAIFVATGPNASRANPATAKWELKLRDENLEVWRAPGRKAYAAVQVQTPIPRSQIAKLKQQVSSSKVTDAKKWILKFAGISNYRPEQQRWVDHDRYATLETSGTYTQGAGKKVKFIEQQFFFESKVVQILYSQPANIPMDTELAARFFNTWREVELHTKNPKSENTSRKIKSR